MSIKVTLENGKAKLYTPYSPAFVSGIKQLSGRWNAASSCWVIPEEFLPDARALMKKIYGEDDQAEAEGGKVTVELTFSRDVAAECAPVVLLGRVIASAHGRDSGARPGEGVAFVEGGCRSGGSRNNWDTVVNEGSVVKVIGIPRATAEHPDLPEYVTLRILEEQDVRRQKLMEEKERLLRRIAEIEEELKED